MKTMVEKMEDFYRRMLSYVTTSEKGQTLVEYALILVLIALVVIVMLSGVGQKVNSVYSTINSSLVP
jgi:pilus assembly protein Flp/PilA